MGIEWAAPLSCAELRKTIFFTECRFHIQFRSSLRILPPSHHSQPSPHSHRFTLVLREMTPASASRALADPGGLASADVVAVLYDEASLESLEVTFRFFLH